MDGVTVHVHRNAGHPWDNRPGFDLLVLDAVDQRSIDAAVAAAERKFWKPWLIGQTEGTNLPGGVLYKPCDADSPWNDSPAAPHPGRVRAPAQPS